MRTVVAIALTVLVASAPAVAEPGLAGTKTITLAGAAGEQLRLGSVTFTPEGDGARYMVALDSPELSPEFLSMRPFRCLHDPKEWWCHLAYPYELSGRVTPADLTDLEYALLFIGKGATSYGIDAWNGLYFRLSLGSDGTIAGRLNETDLNVLAAPPEDRRARVIVPSALTAAEPGAHRFDRLEIR
jgi:hypothetical protein